MITDFEMGVAPEDHCPQCGTVHPRIRKLLSDLDARATVGVAQENRIKELEGQLVEARLSVNDNFVLYKRERRAREEAENNRPLLAGSVEAFWRKQSNKHLQRAEAAEHKLAECEKPVTRIPLPDGYILVKDFYPYELGNFRGASWRLLFDDESHCRFLNEFEAMFIDAALAQKGEKS